MNTKRLSFVITLALGMLVMLMLPLAGWQGASVAHAQGPDVNAARISGVTVNVTPTAGLIMDVEAISNTTIQIDPRLATLVSPTKAITLYKARFELQYDENIVRRVFIDASATAKAFGGVVGDINDDNDGTVFFNLTFNATTPMTVTTATATSLVDTQWQCIDVGTSVLDLVDTDLDMTDGLQVPDSATDGKIICDRPASAIWIDPAAARTFGIGEEVQSTVLVTDVMDVYGIDFGLKFNSTVVKVKDVQATGLLANTRPTWEVRGDLLLFYGRASDSLDGSGPIATITWETLAPGVSPQTFDGVNTKFLDINGQQVKKLQPSSLQPETRIAGGNIIVNPTPAELYFDAAAVNVAAGGTVNQDVKIEGVTNMSEILFRVKFDPSKVQVEDQDPNRPGVQVKVGSLFGNDINVAENVVDNVNGTIDFRVRSQSVLNAADNGSQIATIKWVGLTGQSNLTFVQHAIFDADNANIQHSVRADSDPGSITVSGTSSGTPTATPTTGSGNGTPTATPTTGSGNGTPTATPTTGTGNGTPTATPTTGTGNGTPTATPTTGSGDSITGRVRLQGRTSHTDFKVYADVTPCNLMTPSSANEVAVTPSNNGTNDATFSIQNKGYQCLMVVRQGYLSAQRSNPSGNVGFVELLGGDFTASGAANAINIFDLSYAGSKFGGSDALADFNGDGKVDIFDLAIVAGNYGRTGPISW